MSMRGFTRRGGEATDWTDLEESLRHERRQGVLPVGNEPVVSAPQETPTPPVNPAVRPHPGMMPKRRQPNVHPEGEPLPSLSQPIGKIAVQAPVAEPVPQSEPFTEPPAAH
ncbi:MAG TPA: hypothetical protein VJR27_02015 [Candidatus Saccharimonadales bacterium]|nr:hypothetical protein [Candidatus Saccharimonadales bacterium]